MCSTMESFCRSFSAENRRSTQDGSTGLDIVAWTRKNLQGDEEFWSFVDVEIASWNEDEQLKAVKLLEFALDWTEFEPRMRPSYERRFRFLMIFRALLIKMNPVGKVRACLFRVF